jgi:hypothetical protein
VTPQNDEGHLAAIAKHLGGIDGRLNEMSKRLDAVHRLARATNGRVDKHDVELAAQKAADEARAEERDRAAAALASMKQRRRDRIANLAAGSALTAFAWALAHFLGT